MGYMQFLQHLFDIDGQRKGRVNHDMRYPGFLGWIEGLPRCTLGVVKIRATI